MWMSPEGYGNISSTYFFGFEGSSVTLYRSASSHSFCQRGSISCGLYGFMVIGFPRQAVARPCASARVGQLFANAPIIVILSDARNGGFHIHPKTAGIRKLDALRRAQHDKTSSSMVVRIRQAIHENFSQSFALRGVINSSQNRLFDYLRLCMAISERIHSNRRSTERDRTRSRAHRRLAGRQVL